MSKKDINYFVIQYLGIPLNLTKSNLSFYLYFGIKEGYTKKQLLDFININYNGDLKK